MGKDEHDFPNIPSSLVCSSIPSKARTSLLWGLEHLLAAGPGWCRLLGDGGDPKMLHLQMLKLSRVQLWVKRRWDECARGQDPSWPPSRASFVPQSAEKPVNCRKMGLGKWGEDKVCRVVLRHAERGWLLPAQPGIRYSRMKC